MADLAIIPCRLREAREFVGNFHRHNKAPNGGIFSIGASDGTNMCGVAIVGIPVARGMMNGSTLEVTRCCVTDVAPKNTPSMLYGACWRAVRAMGYTRLITYTLQTEPGISLRAAGWKIIAERKPRSDKQQWTNRRGREWQSVVGQAKFLWEATNGP